MADHTKLCSQCGKSFTKVSYSKRHISSVHGQVQVACPLCGLLIRPNNLNRYIKIFHRSPQVLEVPIPELDLTLLLPHAMVTMTRWRMFRWRMFRWRMFHIRLAACWIRLWLMLVWTSVFPSPQLVSIRFASSVLTRMKLHQEPTVSHGVQLSSTNV